MAAALVVLEEENRRAFGVSEFLETVYTLWMHLMTIH
jgi:hypothetical protein